MKFIEYIALKDLVCYTHDNKTFYVKASTILKRNSVYPTDFQKVVADNINRKLGV